MSDEFRDNANDRISEDFRALLNKIRELRDMAENRQDNKLNSIAFELKMLTCRLANTATLRMYIDSCDDDAKRDSSGNA